MSINEICLRHCMLFCYKMGKNTFETTEMINSALGKNTIDYETVRRRFMKFRARNFCLQDDERSTTLRKVCDDETMKSLAQSLAQIAKIAERLEGGTKIKSRKVITKKRQHSEEEEEEDEEEGESDDEDDEDSDSDTGKKPKKKKRSKKEEDEKDDDDDEDSDNSFNESSGEPPKDYTSGAFVVAKSDVDGANDPPTLWRIDGKALLQKFLPFQEDGKTLYKSTSTYSGWSVNNKDNYIVAHVSFKVQSRAETVVELHLFNEDVKEKED